MNVLEERGLFWWHDERLPDDHFAAPPPVSVAGLLTIEENGRAILELDGVLPSEKGRWAVLHDQGIQSRAIRGLLKVSNQKVLLIDVFGAGGGRVSTNAMSYQRFGAFTCLIGHDPITRPLNKLTFRRLEAPLDGFEEWLWLRSITRVDSRARRLVKYKKPKDVKYSTDEGALLIKYDLDDERSGKIIDVTVSWKEKASLEYRPKKMQTLEELKTIHQLFGELLILLTNSDYPLDWPYVWSSSRSRYRCYFMRIKPSEAAAPPAYYECCTTFPKIRDSFGSIWSNWRKSREEVGAGVYLYVATRRTPNLYIEHRFVNLIVGIEAFHRQSDPQSAPLQEKIARILEQVKATKDRKWLKRKLAYAHEPSLEDRIFELFQALPINVDRNRLRDFCKSCANLRNDMSHFGGPKPPKTYSEFLSEVSKASNALSNLYHILLLQKVGVEEAIIRSWVESGWRSYQIKWDFVQVGLLDKEVLNPKAPPGL